MEVGIQVKQLREQKGLSQTDLGKAIGVDQGVISRYESGAKDIPLDAIIRISTVLLAPKLILSACGRCPAIQALEAFYNMPTENDIVIEQFLFEEQNLTEQLQKLRETQPAKDTPEHIQYVAQVKQLLNRIAVSAYAYAKVFGEED